MPTTARRLDQFTNQLSEKCRSSPIKPVQSILPRAFRILTHRMNLSRQPRSPWNLRYNQYSVTWGSPRFCRALAEKQQHFMGVPINPETEITATCGSTEAMMAALMTVCNPGER